MSSRKWKKVTVRAPAAMEDALSDFLISLTGHGVCSRDEGEDVLIDAYLEKISERELSAIRTYLADLVSEGDLPPETAFNVSDVPEEDWMSVFRSQHTPVRISEKLVVRPAWCDPVSTRDLVLDPGMAFGTGSHSTTRMCLELLDKVLRARTLSLMLDLGTGSGILAIAGAMLGVREVLAIDTDPVAVKVARENIRANNAGDIVKVEEGSVERACKKYDLVVANLSGSLLVNLAGRIAELLVPGGFLIISGITAGEKSGVLATFDKAPLTMLEALEEKEWVAALLRA